jgi:hypothetical protein
MEKSQKIAGIPIAEWVTQSELARICNITGRHVQNLERMGLPADGSRATKRYPIPHAVVWWSEYLIAKELNNGRNPDFLPIEVAMARDRLFWAEWDARSAPARR